MITQDLIEAHKHDARFPFLKACQDFIIANGWEQSFGYGWVKRGRLIVHCLDAAVFEFMDQASEEAASLESMVDHLNSNHNNDPVSSSTTSHGVESIVSSAPSTSPSAQGTSSAGPSRSS